MRAPAQKRTPTARLVLVGLTAGMLVLAACAAAPAAGFDRESQRLQSANDRLAAESQSVLLELYALESRLRTAEAHLAALRGRTAAVERRAEAARRHLALVRGALAEAEDRLEERLRDLYMQGDPDLLAILLGATTLDEAAATLENVRHFASQDVAVLAQVRRARRDVRSAVRELDLRADELRALTREAEEARAGLAVTRVQQQGYLARLLRERRLNAAQLERLAAQADRAGVKTAERPAEVSDEGGEEPIVESSSGSEAPVGPGPAPAAAEPGTQMTVASTGYCLTGTTSTGIAVGWGVVAVDPSVIALGTRMTVPGYGEGVAADTGGAVQGAVIDLWFPTCAQAAAWGRRTVTVTLH